MLDTIKKTVENVGEMAKERFFGPMYFYFLTAWLVTNWKFVYVLLFGGDILTYNGSQISKIDLLSGLYGFNTFGSAFWSLIHLIIIPTLFSYFAVWWFTRISEKFFRKYETYQQNKRVISRELEYTEKVRFSKMEREIRDAESDKKDIEYEDNKEFNKQLDDKQSFVVVEGIMMRPSEVLYNIDYEAYKESLKEWQNESIYNLSDRQRRAVIEEHIDDQRTQYQ